MPQGNHKHENHGHGRRHGKKRNSDANKRNTKINISMKDAPGIIFIKRAIHDGAIVISGTLSADYVSADICGIIAKAFEDAALEINKSGGVVGHIKAAVKQGTTAMISVTDEEAMVKPSPVMSAQVTLAAIVFQIDPEEAEEIIRRAMADIRRSLPKNAT